MKTTKSTLIVMLAMVVTSFAACGPADKRDALVSGANGTNIQRVANLYAYHQARNAWAGPSDEADFKEFIKAVDKRMLDRIGVDAAAVDDLFVSERDGKPFTIRYDVTAGPHGCTEPAIFETEGSNGMRMVGFLNMVQREVDSSEYDRLLDGKGVAPQTARQGFGEE